MSTWQYALTAAIIGPGLLRQITRIMRRFY